jgi:hypothetical protein
MRWWSLGGVRVVVQIFVPTFWRKKMELKNEIKRILRELELSDGKRDWAYRFKGYEDPPFEYGVGLDDPDIQYWVVPAFAGRPTRVFGRSYLPVDEDGPTSPWEMIWDEDLVYLGNFLALWAEGDPVVRLIVRRIGALLLEEENGRGKNEKVSQVWVYPLPPPQRAGGSMPHLRVVGGRVCQIRGGQGVV